jgi:hypothetical protein
MMATTSPIVQSAEQTQRRLSHSQIRLRLDSLFQEVKNIRPPIPIREAESGWITFKSKNSIFEAKQEAGRYVEPQESKFGNTIHDIWSSFNMAAVGALRQQLASEAVNQAYEAVWMTKLVNYGYEAPIALGALATVVQDLDFTLKKEQIEMVGSMMRAIDHGFVPFAAIRGMLVVYHLDTDLLRH